MQIQILEKYDNLAVKSLYLSIVGLLTSIWLLGPLGSVSEQFGMLYLYGGGVFLCTGLSTLLGTIGLILGINALRRRQGDTRIAIAGIILGTISALQILLVVAFLVNPVPIV